MAKQTGLGDNLYVGGFDLSGDVGSIGTIGGGPTALDVTSVDQSAMDRLGGVRDGRIEFSAFYNVGTGRAHPVLSALPTTDVQMMYFRGTTLSGPAAVMIGKQINYDGNRGGDGSFTFDVSAQANAYGLEWGKMLTAGKQTESSAGDGTGVDFAVGSTTLGLQAHVQCFAFTGTSITIVLEESQNDDSGDPYAAVTGGGFAAISAAQTVERIATSATQTIERWLRLSWSGTFSNAVFAVVVNRNDTAPAF